MLGINAWIGKKEADVSEKNRRVCLKGVPSSGLGAVRLVFTCKEEPEIIMKRGIHLEVRKALSKQSSYLSCLEFTVITFK